MKKNFFKFLLTPLLSLALVTPCLAKTKAATKPKTKRATASLTWTTSQIELSKLEAEFRDPKKSEDDKVKLLPETNYKLSETQDLNLSGAEKAEQIHAIISLIAATIESDFANSNTNTVYFDYKENKKAYLQEIDKLKSKKEKEQILEAFKDLEEFEKDMNKPESESENE